MEHAGDAQCAEGCIFCQIVGGTSPAAIVYEDDVTLAFMDINPANPGHVLVIPKRHAKDLFEVDDDDACRVMRTVRRVAQAIDQALRPDGLNLIQANRPAAFQSVFHYHVHVIPRWHADGLVPIWRHQRADPAALRSDAARIRAAIA